MLLSREMNPTSLTNDHLVAEGGLPLQKIQFNYQNTDQPQTMADLEQGKTQRTGDGGETLIPPLAGD